MIANKACSRGWQFSVILLISSFVMSLLFIFFIFLNLCILVYGKCVKVLYMVLLYCVIWCLTSERKLFE
jgi:hypothetical protein